MSDAERWKDIDAASYDAAAGRFDALAERYSGPVADALLETAALKPGERVLDLGAGSGLVALRAARAGAQVEALDHSQGMLDRAAAKARDRGLTLATRCGDAERLEAADGAFDCVVSLFVLKHLPHPDRAAAEIARVLAPGGRAVVGVGAAPALLSAAGVKAALRRLSGRRELTAPHFLRRILGEMGMVPEFELHAHADVAAMLRAAGLTGIRARWTGGAVELDPEGFWEVQAVFGSEERVLLERASDEVRAEVKRRFLERAAAAQAEGARLVYRFGAMIWRAEKARA